MTSKKLIASVACIIAAVCGGAILLTRSAYNGKINTLESENRNLEADHLIEIQKLTNKYEAEMDTFRTQLATLTQENKELTNKILELEMENIELKSAEIQIDPSTEQAPAENSNWKVGEDMLLPTLNTHVKFCTDYRWYQVPGTPHYRMQLDSTTDELGLRRYGNDYVVGLGSYYSTSIGDRFEIILDTGKTFVVILGDGKADCDTDKKNMYTPVPKWYDGLPAANVLEFIIDSEVADPEMISYGSVDYYDEFKGNIIKMTYIGRDTTNDWDTYY